MNEFMQKAKEEAIKEAQLFRKIQLSLLRYNIINNINLL